jgi:hypothetical protein
VSRVCSYCGKKIDEKSEWLFAYPELNFCDIECMEIYRGVRDAPEETDEETDRVRPLDILRPMGEELQMLRQQRLLRLA